MLLRKETFTWHFLIQIITWLLELNIIRDHFFEMRILYVVAVSHVSWIASHLHESQLAVKSSLTHIMSLNVLQLKLNLHHLTCCMSCSSIVGFNSRSGNYIRFFFSSMLPNCLQEKYNDRQYTDGLENHLANHYENI